MLIHFLVFFDIYIYLYDDVCPFPFIMIFLYISILVLRFLFHLFLDVSKVCSVFCHFFATGHFREKP